MNISKFILGIILTHLAISAFAQSGSLEGKVTDDFEYGIEKALVVLTTNDGAVVSKSQTDLDGNFVFKNLSAGKYNLKISLTGYLSTSKNGVSVKIDHLTFVLVILKIDESVKSNVRSNQPKSKKKSKQ